jgi:hypothetical protein
VLFGGKGFIVDEENLDEEAKKKLKKEAEEREAKRFVYKKNRLLHGNEKKFEPFSGKKHLVEETKYDVK